MMTYLKHVRHKKHSDLKTKTFEEIQGLYEQVKRFDENFTAIGTVKDEKMLEKVHKKTTDMKEEQVPRESESTAKDSKEEEGSRKRKPSTRKKMKSRKRRYKKDTSQEDSDIDELRLCLTVAPDEDKEIDYEILDKKYPIIEWKSEYLTSKPQSNEEVNINRVVRSNEQRRYFSTLMRVLSIFDREDLKALYQLVMDKYRDDVPEGFDRVLWGDLMVMFNPSNQDEFWSSQQNWKVYPLKREVLSQMLDLKLETEEDSTMALELIRLVKKQIAELDHKEPGGDEEDL
ncbi:hypothetical protein Tco_1194345 [Tanacetum coccineum]